MSRTNQLLEQVNELLAQSVMQLEEAREVFGRSRDRVEREVGRLVREQDALLRQLGRQTYALAEQDVVPLPRVVKKTVLRLNEVIDRLVKTQQLDPQPRPSLEATSRIQSQSIS